MVDAAQHTVLRLSTRFANGRIGLRERRYTANRSPRKLLIGEGQCAAAGQPPATVDCYRFTRANSKVAAA